MSGLEIWGAVAGAIGTLDAIRELRNHRRNKDSQDLSEFDELDNMEARRANIRAVLSILQNNEETYKRRWETNISTVSKENIEEIWKNIKVTVKRSKKVVDRLEEVLKCDRPRKQDINDCHRELDTNGSDLNTLVMTLNTALDLERPPKTRSTSPPSTPRSRSVTPDQSEAKQSLEYIHDDRLEQVIEEENLEQTKRYLETSGMDANRNSLEATALLLACRHQKKDIVEHCLCHKASTSIHDDCGLDALHAALGTTDRNGSSPEMTDILRLLFDYDVDPSIADFTEQKLTPLHRAATNRDLDSVNIILDQAKTQINATDAQNTTPLWHACTHPSPDKNALNVVQVLASKGGTFGDHAWPKVGGVVADILREMSVK